MKEAVKWYLETVSDLAHILKTDVRSGLSPGEVKKRQLKYGPNQLTESRKVSAVEILISQFKDFMVLVLLAATLISGLLGEYADAATIMAIVIINAILGFVQEFRAEKSMEALKKLTAPEARVVRGGQELRIPAQDLVPGDLIVLDTGDRVPADVRIIETVNLEIEESTLTGESVPVKKSTGALTGEVGLGDRRNMAFLGTVVTRGRGSGVVTATGMRTEMGQIAGLIQTIQEEETPLQRRLEQLGRVLVLICLGICALVVATGIVRGEPAYRMFLAGVSLAVAAIPEGLPAIVTISLAIGVQKMIRKNAIIRKLPAVETLGCATVICSDKTGTLTKNEMTVREILIGQRRLAVTGEGYQPRGRFLEEGREVDPGADQQLGLFLKGCCICNNSRLSQQAGHGRLSLGPKNGWEITGDPTEGALLVAAAKGGMGREQVELKEKRVLEIPFESERKRMTVVYAGPEGAAAYIKGAPDVVLADCKFFYHGGRLAPLTPEIRRFILDENDRMAAKALRVLAVACRELPPGLTLDNPEAVERELTFVGLAGMIDPPRLAARKAVEVCHLGGIKTVMITGDHRVTAQAVARELGMISAGGQVITGPELDQLNDQELARVVNDVAVYARVSPKHKLRIVRSLKQKGHIVAMTGDGVNDAPAIKEAEIGIAMGKTGTDVSKEASAMILADDNFVTIVAAIEEGRAIYDNIRKFIRYLLSCNIGEVLTMFLATLVGLPLPLLPIQILWVNLVTDGLPAMALGVDNADPDIMLRRPRNPNEGIFAQGLGRRIAWRGLQIGLQALLAFVVGLCFTDGEARLSAARTMAFSTLVFSQLFHVFECKSERYSVFQVGFTSNIYLVLAVCCSTLMQLGVVYLPWLQPVFRTVPLAPWHWVLILGLASWRMLYTGVVYLFNLGVTRKLVYMRV